MKKNILYLLMAFVAVIFASCNPLKDAINDIKPNPADVKTMAIVSPSNYESVDAANAGIPVYLNKTYPQMPEGTKANVTYSYKTNTIKPADSLYANVQYTVTDADYSATNGNSNKNFTAAKVLDFLASKYPQATTPVNKLVLLSYSFFQTGVTPSAGTPVLEGYLLQAIGWQKIYLVSPTQFASIGRGVNNAFTSADVANIAGYLNVFLKADPTVSSTAKIGDIKYITYKYFMSASVSHQKIYVLTFDGTNWLPNATLPFLKKNGTWIPDPTVYYTLVKADWTTVGNSTAGTAAGRANYAQFGSFDFTGGANSWTDAQINDALIAVLNAKYPNAPVDPTVFYNLTFAYYKGPKPIAIKTFVKTAAGFVYVPPTAP